MYLDSFLLNNLMTLFLVFRVENTNFKHVIVDAQILHGQTIPRTTNKQQIWEASWPVLANHEIHYWREKPLICKAWLDLMIVMIGWSEASLFITFHQSQPWSRVSWWVPWRLRMCSSFPCVLFPPAVRGHLAAAVAVARVVTVHVLLEWGRRCRCFDRQKCGEDMWRLPESMMKRWEVYWTCRKKIVLPFCEAFTECPGGALFIFPTW